MFECSIDDEKPGETLSMVSITLFIKSFFNSDDYSLFRKL